MRILYSKNYFFITQWDRSISYKILPWMWLRENLVLKPLKYVNTSPQQTHLHLFQGAKVTYYRAWRSPWDLADWENTHLYTWSVWDTSLEDLKIKTRCVILMSNFRTYWVHTHQAQHRGISHTHHTLKNTPISGTHRAVANKNWVDNCHWICILTIGVAMDSCVITHFIAYDISVFSPTVHCLHHPRGQPTWTGEKSLENSTGATTWCKDPKITLVCLEPCYHRRTLQWEKHRMKQQNPLVPGLARSGTSWVMHPGKGSHCGTATAHTHITGQTKITPGFRPNVISALGGGKQS